MGQTAPARAVTHTPARKPIKRPPPPKATKPPIKAPTKAPVKPARPPVPKPPTSFLGGLAELDSRVESHLKAVAALDKRHAAPGSGIHDALLALNGTKRNLSGIRFDVIEANAGSIAKMWRYFGQIRLGSAATGVGNAATMATGATKAQLEALEREIEDTRTLMKALPIPE